MKKFLYHISILILSGIIMLFILDKLYTYLYTNSTPRNKVSHIFSIKNKEIDYVFIGSSRVDNHIDPKIIENLTGKTAINLGIQGAKLNDSYLLLQLLNEHEIKTETIFIQVDYNYNINGNSKFLTTALMPHLKNKLVSELVKERHPDFYYLKNIPFYRYMIYDYKIGFREVFNAAINNEPTINLNSGYYPLTGHREYNFNASLPSTILNENQIIKKIDSFAKKNNMNIQYFTAPFCANTKNIDYTSKLQDKIPGLMDFSRLFSDKDEYFFNCTHLNDKGAKEFSRILAQSLRSD